jgi:hypothetical protein
MARRLAPATIRSYGADVARLDVTEDRAAEIAPEVAGLNNAALAAAAQLELNDEPAQFVLALSRNRQPRGKAR